MEKAIYITGASSQIAISLRNKFSNSGYKVVVFSRNRLKILSNETFVKYRITDFIEPIDGNYEHIIFHFAHDYYDRNHNKNSNVVGLKNIIDSLE